jgi:hypothetical protein
MASQFQRTPSNIRATLEHSISVHRIQRSFNQVKKKMAARETEFKFLNLTREEFKKTLNDNNYKELTTDLNKIAITIAKTIQDESLTPDMSRDDALHFTRSHIESLKRTNFWKTLGVGDPAQRSVKDDLEEYEKIVFGLLWELGKDQIKQPRVMVEETGELDPREATPIELHDWKVSFDANTVVDRHDVEKNGLSEKDDNKRQKVDANGMYKIQEDKQAIKDETKRYEILNVLFDLL